MRKLATVQEVESVKKIKDADFIEIVKMKDKGWQCVVKKDDFCEGDKGIYFEIDSFLPMDERYEFLRKSSYKTNGMGEEGFRLKTCRFRGELSQGLLLPLSLFSEVSDLSEIGTDVTEFLGVKLYEPPTPAHLQGSAKGNFPSFIVKPDQERIQNLKEYFTKYYDEYFEVSVKLDGSPLTCYYNKENDSFGVCSRNLELKGDDKNTYWKVVKELQLEERMRKLGRSIAIQGEMCGEGIQKNRDKIKGHELFVFDIFDIETQKYLSSEERLEIIYMLSDLFYKEIKHVPIIHNNIQIFHECDTMEKMLEYAKGVGMNSKMREGIVCKMNNNPNIHFKVINNDYLLKYEV